MKTFNGQFKRVRIEADKGSLDKYKWRDFRNGELVPVEFEKAVFGTEAVEVPSEQRVEVSSPEDVPKKKFPAAKKKSRKGFLGKLSGR